jgi:hypothetical protein
VPSLKQASSLYDQSFAEVLAFKDAEPTVTTLGKYETRSMCVCCAVFTFPSVSFTETLVGIRRRHTHIVPMLARVNPSR